MYIVVKYILLYDVQEEVNVIHERVLRANTKDYGKYDPSPTFVKPPFKLIPN